ncbi:MAG: histidine--tRNA ligase [Clostridia bacterium]|nr:histidine--tRNA ligase [Clostridia bacterium]
MGFVKNPVKGMCDILPQDMRLRERALSLIKSAYSRYGFEGIETPVMESIDNLLSKQGGENEKLIFKVLKNGADLQRALERGGELAESGLRYDLTLPLARYYSNNTNNLASPFKALQIGSVFRADKPQKGRFRQFTQCDIDILGDESNFAEIELISATAGMLCTIFSEMGINDRKFKVHINDRRILLAIGRMAGFTEDEVSSALISLDKLDKIGFDGVRAELIENGYNEQSVDKYLGIYSNAEGQSVESFCAKIGEEYLDLAVAKSLNEIIECATASVPDTVELCFDPTLVRGMGYYTGPIFEVTTDGYGFSIAGGGRYDKMIGKFTGKDTCAVGFSIGFERIITILKDYLSDEAGKLRGEAIAYLIDKRAPLERKMEIYAEAQALRADGKTVTIVPMKKNLKFQIEELEKIGYTKFNKIYND